MYINILVVFDFLVGGSIAPSYEAYISRSDRFDRIC